MGKTGLCTFEVGYLLSETGLCTFEVGYLLGEIGQITNAKGHLFLKTGPCNFAEGIWVGKRWHLEVDYSKNVYKKNCHWDDSEEN